MVYFRCVASGEAGLGHIRRCLVLARQFRRHGRLPVFLVPDDETGAAEILKRENMAMHRLPPALALKDEPEHYPVQCRDLIVDILSRQNLCNQDELVAYLNRLVNDGRRVLFFDGLFNDAFRNGAAPILFGYLQPYPGAEEDLRPNAENWFAGSKYAVLEEAFWEAPVRAKSLRADRILVTFGGSDPQNNTLEVMGALAEQPADLAIRVIIGPWFSEEQKERIRGLAHAFPGRFELYENQSDLVSHYQWAQLGITGSGTSRFEMAAMGLPCLFVAIYAHHAALAESFARAGTSVYLGPADASTAGGWQVAVSRLRENQSLRQRLSRCGSALFDGRGAERLITRLMEDHDYGS